MRPLTRPERPTRINGVSDFRRPYVIGSVKIGETLIVCRKCKHSETYTGARMVETLKCPKCGNTNAKAKDTKVYTRPAKLDYFRIVPDDENHVSLIGDQYGKEPKTIDVKLPFYVPVTRDEPDPVINVDRLREAIFPQSLTHFVKSGLVCAGDGNEAVRYEDNPDGAVIPCPFEGCKDYQAGKCSPSARLFLHLYRLPEFGSFLFSTRSWNSIVDINSGIDYVYSVAQQIADVNPAETMATILPRLPLTLKIKEGRGKDDAGKTTRYSKVSLGLGADLLKLMANTTVMLPGAEVAALPAAAPAAAAYVENDVDARRRELLIEVKSAGPYRLNPADFPNGEFDYDDIAKVAAEGKRFTETITGRSVALNHLTTPELEKLRAAQLDLTAERESEPEPEPPTDAEPADDNGMYGADNGDVVSAEIRVAEVEKLNAIVEKSKMKPADLAPMVNDVLKTDYKVITAAVTKSWPVDKLVIVREHIEMLLNSPGDKSL